MIDIEFETNFPVQSVPNEHARVGRIKAWRLGRIAANVYKLEVGSYFDEETHAKGSVAFRQNDIHLEIERLNGSQSIWRTIIDVAEGAPGLSIPQISATRARVHTGDEVVSQRQYDSAESFNANDLGLYEVARVVRFAGGLCAAQNLVTNPEG